MNQQTLEDLGAYTFGQWGQEVSLEETGERCSVNYIIEAISTSALLSMQAFGQAHLHGHRKEHKEEKKRVGVGGKNNGPVLACS